MLRSVVRSGLSVIALGSIGSVALAQGLPPGLAAPQSFTPSSGPSPAAASTSASGSGSVSGVKHADPDPLGQWYGTVELRHHINTYYDQHGYLSHQDPSLHARLQVGSLFYDGMIDAYATIGAFKMPHSEQIMERRPEAALDFYPVRNRYLQLLQYNLVQFPVSQDNSGIDQDTDADDKDDYSNSTTYLTGFAPMAKLPLVLGASRLELKAGLDGWTKMYSRKQYAAPTNVDTGDETDQGRLDLNLNGTTTNEGVNPVTGEPIEDYAMHYQSQAMTGFALAPSFARGLLFDTSVFFNSRFDPIYTVDTTGKVSYHYDAQRYTYYRVRLHYDLTDRVSVTNDFYQFHDGFFQAERYGDNERRFRNIARVTCKL